MPAFLFTGTQANIFSNTANRLIPLEFLFLPATSFSFSSAFCITSKYQSPSAALKGTGNTWGCPTGDTFVVSTGRGDVMLWDSCLSVTLRAGCELLWGHCTHLWLHVGPWEFLTYCLCNLPQHSFTDVSLAVLVDEKHTWNLVLAPKLMHIQPWFRLITRQVCLFRLNSACWQDLDQNLTD